MRGVRALLLALACLAAATAAGAGQEGTAAAPRRLLFVGSDDFPPYQYLDDNGVPQGFNIELVRALAREAGVAIDIRLLPWHAARAAFERREAQLIAVGHSDARAKRYAYLLPIWRLRQLMLHHPRAAGPIRRIEDMRGERIAVTEGSLMHEELLKLGPQGGTVILPVPGQAEAVEALRTGAATVAVANELWTQSTNGAQLRGVVASELRSIPYYLATQREREDLIPIFADAYSRLQESGEFSSIVERSLVVYRDSWLHRNRYLVAAVLTLAGMAVLVMALWGRSLRAQVQHRTRELKQAEASYRQLVESVRVIVWRMDPGTERITFVSHEAETILGYPIQAWLEDPGFWSAHVHSDDREMAEDARARARIRCQPCVIEYRMLAADGRTVWLRDLVQVVEDDRGVGLVGVMVDVTESREAARQQAFSASVLAQVSDAIIATDNNLIVTTWNEGATALFGIPASKAAGRALGTLIAYDVGNATMQSMHIDILSAGQWRGEGTIRRATGETVHVEAVIRALRDEAANIVGRLLVVHDVDARKRAETEARTRARQQATIATIGQRALAGVDIDLLSQQALALVADTLQVPVTGIFELTSSGMLLRHGVGWVRAVPGQTLASSAPGTPLGLALQSESPAVISAEREALQDPMLRDEEVETTVALIVPGWGRSYGVLLVAARAPRTFGREDVHFLQAVANVLGASLERRRVEEELRSAISLHRATLESTDEGIVAVDQAGRVTSYNRRFLDLWGLPKEVAENGTQHTLRRATAALVEDGFEPEPTSAPAAEGTAAATIRLKDGRVIERQSLPQRSDGEVIGRVWCYRDVTDRVRSLEEQRRLEAHILEVQKLESLGVLAGGIAHDFNNLLVGMLGYAGLVLGDLTPDSPLHDRVKQIEIAALRAAELTNQMLAYSGRGRFIVQAVSLSGVVQEIANLLHTAISKNVQLDLRLAEGLPAVEADTAQIRQVVMNLITNASDAIGEHQGRVEVSTGRMHVSHDYLADACLGTEMPEGEYVYVEVRDDGCGMDVTTQRRIFDPFFTTKFTGRGLGLAAVLGIVRGHRGAIKLDSIPGAGTTFRVLFPAAAAARADASPKRAVAAAQGARVLVVDDEETVRNVTREMLTRAGFLVRLACDGVEAVEVVQQEQQIDVVLLDMTMPRMNGIDALRTIRKLRPALPVVLTSGYSEEEAAHRFVDEGLAGFIQKPFFKTSLVSKIQDALASREGLGS